MGYISIIKWFKKGKILEECLIFEFNAECNYVYLKYEFLNKRGNI